MSKPAQALADKNGFWDGYESIRNDTAGDGIFAFEMVWWARRLIFKFNQRPHPEM